MIRIVPSILSSDFSKLGDEVARIDHAGADLIHIDVMDGHFVPNLTFGPLVIKALRKVTKLPFDVHLMISNPGDYIDAYADAGADIITVHAEACSHLDRVLQSIRQRGIKAAVALNPATSLSALDWSIDKLDMVLLMTVNPGFGGQSYIPAMTEKIRALRSSFESKGLGIDIEIDGGISPANIYEVTEAGADVIVAGSAIFNAPDPAAVISEMKQKAWSK